MEDDFGGTASKSAQPTPVLSQEDLGQMFGPRIPIRAIQHLFDPKNEHKTVSEMRVELMAMASEITAKRGSRNWCQPGDVKQRQWLLTFDDTEMGHSLFSEEAEAREMFRRADEGGWNCYLFQAAPMA